MKTLQTELPKFTHHNELRRRTIIDCSEPKLTDQSHKNMCDINLIIAQYQKTGLFQHISKIQPQYKDNTTNPTLEASFNFVNQALNLFNQLPPTIRKLMDNNPANMDSFISNPENADILKKHGLLVEKPQVLKPNTDPVTSGGPNGTNPDMSDGSN